MYKQINKMMRMLDKEIEMQAKREPLIKNGVSQGFGIYKIIEDCSNIREYKTIDEVLAYADDRMYRAKASKKKAEI